MYDVYLQYFTQERPCNRFRVVCQFFRGARCNNHSSGLAAFRPHVKYIVDALEHIQIMFNYYHGVTLLDKLLKDIQQNL